MLDDVCALVIHHDCDLRRPLAEALEKSRATGSPGAGAGCDAPARGRLADGRSPNVVVLAPDSQMDAPEILRQVRADPRCRFSAVVVVAATEPRASDREGFLPGEVWTTSPVDLPDLLLAVALGRERAAAESARLITREPDEARSRSMRNE